jgi:tyrosyl-DNA phosphodiesterase-1
MGSHEPPSKKRKLEKDKRPQEGATLLASLNRAITPPPLSSTATPAVEHDLPLGSKGIPNRTQLKGEASTAEDESDTEDESIADDEKSRRDSFTPLSSPIQLTRIRDLPASSNVDTVGLDDLLGDPMIKELWNFNFLFDLDFVM